MRYSLTMEEVKNRIVVTGFRTELSGLTAATRTSNTDKIQTSNLLCT